MNFIYRIIQESRKEADEGSLTNLSSADTSRQPSIMIVPGSTAGSRRSSNATKALRRLSHGLTFMRMGSKGSRKPSVVQMDGENVVQGHRPSISLERTPSTMITSRRDSFISMEKSLTNRRNSRRSSIVPQIDLDDDEPTRSIYSTNDEWNDGGKGDKCVISGKESEENNDEKKEEEEEEDGQEGKGKVPKERIDALWSFVRSKFITFKFNILDLLTNAIALQIPYTLTLKQGFQFKYKLRSKYQIKCMIIHPRVPWHHIDGRVNVEAHGYDNDSDRSDDEDDEGGSGNELSSKAVSKFVPYTFVSSDSSRTVRLWDVARAAVLKPRAILRRNTAIEAIAFISRFRLYACSDGSKSIDVTKIYHCMTYTY
jgi:hypothetical protein